MLARLSPTQRTVLGFPARSSQYWANGEAIAAIEARYHGALDLSAYRKTTLASRL